MSPRKSYRTVKKNLPDSFKYKLGSTTFIYSIVEFRQMMMLAADEMEAAGITHVKPCNLYVSPVDAKGNSITLVRGEPLENKTIAHPYRSAADEHGA
jgi:hypothetical protein